ncbi:MAG: AEC family transporter [Verrucomicrobia bacterium]|nr:AEC family transporter [Verrucomicrobiota bacterium]
MNEFWVVISAVLPVFAIAGLGGLLRKLDWLTEEADKSLLRVTINLLVPCFIFERLVGNTAVQQLGNVTLAPLVGFGTVALGIGIGWLARKFTGVTDDRALRTFAFSVGIYNYGYVPLPLAQSLFGHETVGVLIVHNVGVEIAFWTLGMLILGDKTGEPLWKKIFNPPVAAILVSLAVNFAGVESSVPKFVTTTTRMLGECAIPLGLVLTGAIMADFLHEFHSASGWRMMALACALRMLLVPALFLALAYFLPCSVELKRVIVLQSAMPAAVFNIIMARHYGGDAPTALRVVIATSAVSLVTIPLCIRLGMKLVGL